MLKRTVQWALTHLHLDRLSLLCSRGSIQIIMFHGFTDRRDFDGIANCDGKHLHVGIFEEIVSYLSRRFSVVPLSTVADALSGGSLPPNPVVLSFDDGYGSNHHLAYPVLRKYDVPAVVSLTTDFIESQGALWADRLEYAVGHTVRQEFSLDFGEGAVSGSLRTVQDRVACLQRLKQRLKTAEQGSLHDRVECIESYLGCRFSDASGPQPLYAPVTWEQAREMADSGLVELASHTRSHRIVGRTTAEIARQEIVTSKELIEERTGRPCTLFCYPNGKRGDFTPGTRQILVDAGFACALTTEYGRNDIRSDPFELKRVGIDMGHDMGSVVLMLSGVRRY